MSILTILLYSLAVSSIGMFCGIMLSLVVILQKHWNQMEGGEYLIYFKGFLQAAKGNKVISIITFLSFLLPVILFLLNTDGIYMNSKSLIFSSTIFFIGCFLVTVFFNLPIYEEIVSWNGKSDKSNWQSIKNRFFLLNLIRFFSSFLSLIIISVSLVI